jgi:hypothetical protein
MVSAIMALTIHPPFYLLRSHEICWKCRAKSEVIAFAATGATDDTGDDEFEIPDFSPMILKDIEELPEVLKASAVFHEPFLKKRRSNAAGIEYFMNLCPCGAPFGDYFLHSEPGHAFFPTQEEEAALIRIQEIDCASDLAFTGEFAGSIGMFIFESATFVSGKISPEP